MNKQWTKQVLLPRSGYEEMELWTRGDGELHMSIENPWAGDTESGFGATCHATFNVDAAQELRSILDSWLMNP